MAPMAVMPRGLKTPPAAVFRANCAFKAPQCDQGHQLFICVCRVGAQVCDACMRRIQSTYTHRCKICDFDLCRRCYSSPTEDSLQASLRPLLEESSVRSSSGVEDARDGPADPGSVTEAQAGDGMTSPETSDQFYDARLQASSGPFAQAPWRLAYPEWSLSEHRNEQMRSLYGDRRPVKLPAWFRGGSARAPAGVRPPVRALRDAAPAALLAYGAADPAQVATVTQSVPPIDGSSAASSASAVGGLQESPGAVAEAASAAAALGMPQTERLWRTMVAEKVAVAIGSPELPKSRRPSPRTASWGAKYRKHGIMAIPEGGSRFE